MRFTVFTLLAIAGLWLAYKFYRLCRRNPEDAARLMAVLCLLGVFGAFCKATWDDIRADGAAISAITERYPGIGYRYDDEKDYLVVYGDCRLRIEVTIAEGFNSLYRLDGSSQELGLDRTVQKALEICKIE